MANIANNTWQTSRQTSTINITANSTSVDFNMGISLTDEMCCAKACVAIDASKYQTITLQYELTRSDGISSIYFGVFDSMTARYSSGITSASSSGIGMTQITSSSDKTITINIPGGTTGTKYVGFLFYGNTYTLNENVGWSVRKKVTITSLTATERGYTLTYDANGGSGAPGSVGNITSTTISSTVPTRTGYDFLGWSTSSSATSASYVAGNSISLSSNTTLYAVWKKKTYTITYDANGGSNAPSDQEKLHGEDLILTESIPTPPPEESITYTVYFNANGGICDTDFIDAIDYEGYRFAYWDTDIDGRGTEYDPGGIYSQDSDVTLFAQYSSYYHDNGITLPIPTRENHIFLGWATDPYATSGITGRYNPDDNVTFYAIWKCKGNVYINDGSGFNPYQVLINDGSGWNQYIPYIYTEAGWEVYSG
jgi:uncharacterized repeat protein (TIGR02543 family)